MQSFQKLLNMMDELRAKCPWGKEQTFDSLRYLTIEETYELSDSIIKKNYMDVCKELGDLLLHIVFYAKIGEEENLFNIEIVIERLCEKLVHRHPHVFGDIHVDSVDEVKKNWEKIKLKGESKSVLGGVPNSLPAMVKAYRIQEKARGVGFDWDNTEQVWEKVQEELAEFNREKNQNSEKMEDEFGDILFALINYARFMNINPEDALEKTNRKFIQRFNFIEQKTKELGKPLSEMDLDEMEALWQQAKKE